LTDRSTIWRPPTLSELAKKYILLTQGNIIIGMENYLPNKYNDGPKKRKKRMERTERLFSLISTTSWANTNLDKAQKRSAPIEEENPSSEGKEDEESYILSKEEEMSEPPSSS
jgi:hypothetical protein